MEKKKDLITGVCIFVASLLYLIKSFSIKVFVGTGATVINSRTIPIVWGLLLMALSVVLIVRGLTSKYEDSIEEEENDPEEVCLKHKYAVPATLGLIILYAFLIKRLGFILDSTLYLFLQMFIIGPKKMKRLWLLFILSAAGSALIFYIFVYLLNVPLPQGLISF